MVYPRIGLSIVKSEYVLQMEVNKKMKPDLSIVIPAFNESLNVMTLCGAFVEFVRTVSFSIQIVFVDDGSSDNTVDLLLRQQMPSIQKKIVKLSRNFGAHAAMRAGVFHADADRIMFYSMDMPEAIEDIASCYAKLDEGYEIVYTVRKGYHGSLGSRIFGGMINRFIEETYPAEGILGVAFGQKVKRELNTSIEANSSLFFQIFRMGFSRFSIPVEYAEREQGESKWTFGKKLKLFVDSFVMFSYTPIRAISVLGAIMAAAGILWALAIIITKLFNTLAFAAGWPTTMSILLVGFGITNLSLGVIAEYLVRTLEAAKGEKTFIVDEVVESD